MIVAVLADIHGNGPALRAVLDHLPSVDLIVCAGDAVGYYPDAAEVVDRLRALAVPMVRGNHELMVCGRRDIPPERATAYRSEWTRHALSAEQLRWLDALPPTLEFAWDDLRVRVRHASPWDEETYVYPDSPRLPTIELHASEWLILGHTHYPMLARGTQGWVANPGSVGQPRDWNPRAAYALLDTARGEWRQVRVDYDVAAYQRRLESLSWDAQPIAVLSRVRGPATPSPTHG